MLPPIQSRPAIEAVIREDWGRALAFLASRLGDFQRAEDSLQDAVEAALRTWPDKGLPNNPAAWLITTARRKAIDRIRREQNFTKKSPDIAYLQSLNAIPEEDEITDIPDKRLEMMFTCCHPALPETTRIALTLRTVAGLSVDEIAAAFLTKSTAMAQRLTRAKSKIRLAGIPYKTPERAELAERLQGVLAVIYLIFNAGYGASKGAELVRADLTLEAIRLARILTSLLPDEPEVMGLLALMLLHDSRRFARQNENGEMIPLEFQNRAQWDAARITEGRNILKSVLPQQHVGPYQIQAAISAVHVDAESWEVTDWPQILGLYSLLYAISPTPVIKLNQAVAASYAGSAQAGLAIITEIETNGHLQAYQPLFASKADMLNRSGQYAEALSAYDRAIALSGNEIEKSYLLKQRRKAKESLSSKP